jgi:hypothetical protein
MRVVPPAIITGGATVIGVPSTVRVVVGPRRSSKGGLVFGVGLRVTVSECGPMISIVC